MVDKLLISVFATILAVVIAMQVLLCSLPLFRRLEFDAVCHKYTLLMDRAGGLDGELSANLRRELYDRGFLLNQLSGTPSTNYGGNLELFVIVSFKSNRLTSSLVAEEVIISLEYQSSTICRVLKNYAVVP